ncbi:hypothetical protein V8D89_005576 [Ganoderma adspersum]
MSPDNSTLPSMQLNAGALAYLQRVARTEGDTMSQISLASLSFGILTILVGTSVYFLISRGSAAQTNGRILLLGTILLYMTTATYMAALIWFWKNRNYFVERANDGLFSPFFDGEADSAALKRAVRQQSWLLTVALGGNFAIGDAIVWWRACVIWQHKVVTCIGPLLRVPNGFDLNIMYGSSGFGPASLVLSFTTNILATSLIGYKAWEQRQLLKQHFAEARATSRVLKALALLTESGCMYSALLVLILAFILFIAYHADPPTTKGGPNYAFEVIANDFEYGCLVPLVAIYPTTIIAIVALKQSPIDNGGLSQARQAPRHRRGSGPGAVEGDAASTVVFQHSTLHASTFAGDTQDATEGTPTPDNHAYTHSYETSRSRGETKVGADNLV